MTTCLKYCVPLAAVCFVGAVVWTLNAWPSPHDFATNTLGYRFGEVRERWVLAAEQARAGDEGVSRISPSPPPPLAPSEPPGHAITRHPLHTTHHSVAASEVQP